MEGCKPKYYSLQSVLLKATGAYQPKDVYFAFRMTP